MSNPAGWQPLTVAAAIALGWDPGPSYMGKATRAYDEWRMVSRDQRVYLKLTLDWMNERFEAVWQEIQESPATEDSPGAIDVFNTRVGIEPLDWQWMLLAGLLRDAVTAYEVYVVKAYLEVVEFQEGDYRHDKAAPKFGVAWAQSKILGLDVRSQAVNEVFQLRNILTHQRGQLRTQKDRAKYGDSSFSWSSIVAHLDEAKVVSLLDMLDASVNDLDPIYWAYAWGRQPGPSIKA